MKRKNKGLLFLILPTWIVLAVVFGYYYKSSYGELIRDTIMLILSFIVMHYCLSKDIEEDKLFSKEYFSYGKFYSVNLVLMALSMFFPLLPISGWIFPPMFALVTLNSSFLSGLMCSISYLMMATIFSGARYGVFILYLEAGIIAVFLVKKMFLSDKKYIYVIINTLFDLITLGAIVVFYQNFKLDAEFFIVPFINILLSNILLLMIAGFAQTYIFDSETRKYIKINDQTALLLTKLKDSNKEEYLKRIHLSYFSSFIGKVIGANPYLCKGGGYYYNIDGIIKDTDVYKSREDLLADKAYPEDLINLVDDVKDYIDNKSDKTLSKEFLSLYLANEIVNSIYDHKIKYDNFDNEISSYFDTLYSDGCLKKALITFEDFENIKSGILSQKKYIKMMNI